jgi:hypothetical protein
VQLRAIPIEQDADDPSIEGQDVHPPYSHTYSPRLEVSRGLSTIERKACGCNVK